MTLRTNCKKFILLLLMAVIFSVSYLVSDAATASQSNMSGGVAVPIIIYHKIKYNNLSKLTISPYEFDSDLKYLQAGGYTTITIDDLISFQKGAQTLPEKPIIICFDDGYLNTYVYAYPLLKKYGMKAVLSIIGKDADDYSKVNIKDLDYAHTNWSQIVEMSNSGVFEIQNHSYSLHLATNKRYGCTKNNGEDEPHYEKVLADDLKRLQQEVYEKTGRTPTAFTYPFGRVSRESEPVIKRLGFKASLTCVYGINVITKDPDKLYGLKRIARYHGISLKKTIDEGFKTLH
jgi:peptidoglycan/xylan/chitin deacetylase (PgdA/CDA1 family)